MTRVCLVYFSPTGGTKLVAHTAAKAMADELNKKYNAKTCAKLVLEAAEVYEKRGILL